MMHAFFAIGFISFFLVYLVVKTLYFQKKYGVNPLAALHGNFQEKLLWISLPLIFIGYAIAIWMGLWTQVWSVVGIVVGSCLMVLGFSFMVIAQFQMGRNWRMGVDSQGKIELVDSGVFGFSRNPVYLGLLVQALGVTVVFLNLYTVLLWVLLFFLLFLIVLQEEKFLLTSFGKEYLRYCKSVGRFL